MALAMIKSPCEPVTVVAQGTSILQVRKHSHTYLVFRHLHQVTSAYLFRRLLAAAPPLTLTIQPLTSHFDRYQQKTVIGYIFFCHARSGVQEKMTVRRIELRTSCDQLQV